MTARSNSTVITKDRQKRQLIIERILEIPRALVWASWTQPEHIARWWGPAGWTTVVHEMDIRPGGNWHYCLKPSGSSDGQESWGKAIYQEVVEPSLLVYNDAFSDAAGNIQDGTTMPTRVEFEQLPGDHTRLTIRTQFATVEDLDLAKDTGMIEGFTETLDRLTEFASDLLKANYKKG